MSVHRFGVFEFDADRLELSREGRPVRLQPQPAQVLATLLANAGRTVTRDELKQAVWRDDTFVDFDRGLNFCVAQIRTALGDDATTPRYVRTVPKRGYEFIAPVKEREALAERRRNPSYLVFALISVALVATAAAIVYRALRTTHLPPIVAVARFDNETDDPALARFADNLTDDVTVQLTQASGGQFGVIGNAALLRVPRQQRDLTTIWSSLRAEFIVLGQVQRDSDRVRVLAHLIHMPDQTHLKVSRTDDLPAATLKEAGEIAARIAATFASQVGARRESSVANLRAQPCLALAQLRRQLLAEVLRLEDRPDLDLRSAAERRLLQPFDRVVE
jgi:DNA-binding winged helix-turn-helix (wHTH) protein/TolB-like protein